MPLQRFAPSAFIELFQRLGATGVILRYYGVGSRWKVTGTGARKIPQRLGLIELRRA